MSHCLRYSSRMHSAQQVPKYTHNFYYTFVYFKDFRIVTNNNKRYKIVINNNKICKIVINNNNKALVEIRHE